MKKEVSGAMLALLLINMLSLTFNIQLVKAEPDIITRYPWPMFRHNLGNTGYSESPAPRTNKTQWKYTLSYSGLGWRSAAVVDGKVYIGLYDNKILCLNALTGALIWNYTTGGRVDFSSPAVVDGRVYVGAGNGKVYCLDASTAALIWNYTTGDQVESSPAVADGKVYIGSWDRRIYCLNALTGALIWNYTTVGNVQSSPAVANGKVYVGSEDRFVYCLDALTGAKIWNYDTFGNVQGSPSVVDGRVYIGSPSQKIYCLNALTGAIIWSYTTGGGIQSSPSVVDGKVYIGSNDNKIYCLNALTGAIIWSYTTGDDVHSSAVADGKVYVGSRDNKVYCLNAETGTIIWSYTTGGMCNFSPAVADGVAYFVSYDKTVYAFGDVVRVPEDYSTIQGAINASSLGATISIALGTYHESLTISKTLTILGRKGSDPILSGSGSGTAINLLPGASGSIVAGISIADYDKGIVIKNSSNCKIYDNIMTQMVDSGVAIEGSLATNNRIYRNIINSNNIAINLTQSSNSNIIYDNTMLENGVGIALSNSNGNTIYHNNFVSNTQQVTISNSLNNVWDNDYPSGGNYWSDYTGKDVNGDSIGDTPYVIDASNRDEYPLMGSWPCEITPSSTRYPWSMFHHDLRHTGYSESPAPGTNRTQWEYTAGDQVASSPAVVDGRVYVGSNDNRVYCLDALTGAHIWNYTTGGWVFSCPAVADGRVYAGSFDRHVYCLDALSGAHIWNYTTGAGVYSPAVADGRVYVGSYDKHVYCLDALTGAYIWNYTTGDPVSACPTVVNNRVYFGSGDGNVYALNASNGAFFWSYATGASVVGSAAVVDCKVYVGSNNGNVYALTASNGAFLWSYPTGNVVESCPAVVGGRVYVGSFDFNVYCLDALSGAHIWTYPTGGTVASSPAVAGGKVYFGSYDKNVYCLNASSGARVWSYTTEGYVWSSPAIADDMVFIGSNDGKLYAFGDVIRVPEDYPTVQGAINNATSGATISIALGIYYESVIINKPLTILGRKGSAPTFVGGGSGIAFTISASASGTIIAGIVITNYAQAIFIDDASNCKIYDNIMTLNVNSGVAEGNNAANNLIYSNIFQQNPGAAINLTQYSAGTAIYNNTIILNSIGLSIESGGNIIYWNIFIDNTRQVNVESSLSNNWDNGYPDGGNYWSGYTGVDEKSGPGQNLAGSDGIGDTQYTIDIPNNIVDRYPLMKPFSAHDIGITNVIPSKTVIGQGFTLHIDLKILNYGIHNELFTTTVSVNAAIIATQIITLTKRNSTTITLTWNTTGFAKGNYTISAIATSVPDETDTLDNSLTDGWILITKVGDLGGPFNYVPTFFKIDGKIDAYDLALFIACYKGQAGNAQYLGDLGGPFNYVPTFFKIDGKIDAYDLALFIACYKGLGPPDP